MQRQKIGCGGLSGLMSLVPCIVVSKRGYRGDRHDDKYIQTQNEWVHYIREGERCITMDLNVNEYMLLLMLAKSGKVCFPRLHVSFFLCIHQAQGCNKLKTLLCINHAVHLFFSLSLSLSSLLLAPFLRSHSTSQHFFYIPYLGNSFVFLSLFYTSLIHHEPMHNNRRRPFATCHSTQQ